MKGLFCFGNGYYIWLFWQIFVPYLKLIPINCVTKTKTLSNFNQNKRKINNIWIWYVHWFDISRLWYFDYSEIVQATDIYDSSMVSEFAIVLISSLKGVGIFKKSAYSTKLSLSVRSSHAFKPEILWSKAFALESWLLFYAGEKSLFATFWNEFPPCHLSLHFTHVMKKGLPWNYFGKETKFDLYRK